MKGASFLISQLISLVKKAEGVEQKISKVAPLSEEWAQMTDLSQRLVTVASRLQHGIQSSKVSRTEQAWKESEKIRQEAEQYQKDLAGGKVHTRLSVFRRNIALIFKGPRMLQSDSTERKNRKNITLQRCLQLRSLHPDGVLYWSISYPASSWGGGEMAGDVFNNLIETIEPSDRKIWHPKVLEVLLTIKDEELSDCPPYEQFLQGD
jgi:hypothetical protein